jgi:adenylate cyclase
LALDILDGHLSIFSKEYSAAVLAMQGVLRLSPGQGLEAAYAYRYVAISLAQLGRNEEAREWLDKAIAAAPSVFDRFVRHRIPWMRPQDYAHMVDGVRKAGWNDDGG